ncbi:MAG TPA: type II toxin-antitoxin system HicB family antitoxin [Bacillota bacterium]|jgi:hypothetical protein|nr:type II toxin-antitoxin system HicB family antitoxin [Bacillota bacterium]HPZ14764.1 type II toxin-antitoxin system HicB family antitoxin [Bacillota bacterium]HQD81301.1 type II toxin-antitoxin system HicB family antitoxin [Bacillota bacterium]
MGTASTFSGKSSAHDDHIGYSARLNQIAEADGGGWLAEVPELPVCMCDGETPEEALISVSEAI